MPLATFFIREIGPIQTHWHFSSWERMGPLKLINNFPHEWEWAHPDLSTTFSWVRLGPFCYVFGLLSCLLYADYHWDCIISSSWSIHIGNDSYLCTTTLRSLLSLVRYDLVPNSLYNNICPKYDSPQEIHIYPCIALLTTTTMMRVFKLYY